MNNTLQFFIDLVPESCDERVSRLASDNGKAGRDLQLTIASDKSMTIASDESMIVGMGG